MHFHCISIRPTTRMWNRSNENSLNVMATVITKSFPEKMFPEQLTIKRKSLKSCTNLNPIATAETNTAKLTLLPCDHTGDFLDFGQLLKAFGNN